MMEELKNVFYAGIGLAVKSKEKVEETAKKFAEERKMNTEEGKAFIENMVKKSEETRDELANFVQTQIRQTLDTMGLVTKKDFDSLKSELDEVKKKQDTTQ